MYLCLQEALKEHKLLYPVNQVKLFHPLLNKKIDKGKPKSQDPTPINTRMKRRISMTFTSARLTQPAHEEVQAPSCQSIQIPASHRHIHNLAQLLSLYL